MRKFQIITPEQVGFHYEIAGLVARYLAWLLDQLVIFICYVLIIIGVAMIADGEWGVAAILLLLFCVDFSYFTAFELYRSGQTPGKRAFRLRVISARGTRLRFSDVLVRNLLRPVDNLPWAGLLGGMFACIDRRHRRLGDLAAETIVVREERKVIPHSLSSEKNRRNTFETDGGIRTRVLSRVTRIERDLILDLAVRRDQMDADVREELFESAASHFRKRFALPDDLHHLSDEQTVVNLALLIQESKFTA